MNINERVIALLSREEDPMTADRVSRVLNISKRKVYRIVLAEIERLNEEAEESNDEEE